MSDLITIEAVDVDNAIGETAEAAGATRADFLKRGGAAGAGFLAGGVLLSGLVSPAEAAISTRHRSKKNDVKIANYALTLEYLEAEFYRQAVTRGGITQPALRHFANVVANPEASHVKALQLVLGSKAMKEPRFDFGDTVTDEGKFRQTAQTLEDTGVAAYAGQGPNLLQRPLVKAALSIHSVEARHAAWIRYLNFGGGGDRGAGNAGQFPAPRAFDRAKSEKRVRSDVKSTGFIKG